MIVVAAAIWTTSALGVVRCESNGKVEYRDAPCPTGSERTLNGVTTGASSQSALPPPPATRPTVAAKPSTDAQREDENERFLQQERRIREERLQLEAKRATVESASKSMDVKADVDTPPSATLPASPLAPQVPAPAVETAKVAPAGANRQPEENAGRSSTSKFGGAYLYLLPLAIVVILAVVKTRRGSGSAVRWSLAAILGLLFGFLLYFITFMLFMPKGGPGPIFVLFTLSSGWVLSAWFLGNNAESLLRVLRRGMLLGAIEWLIVIPASWVWTGRAVVSTVEQIGPAATGVAGAIIGGGLIALLTGGVALFMLVLCAIGYLIVYLLQRGRAPAPTLASQEARFT